MIAPSIPDPTTAPLDALSLADKLYHSGAYLLLGIVLVFMGLRWARDHVAWLEAPNRAHYVTALLAGLALIAVPASQGTTPNLSMIVIAFGTVISLCAPGRTPAPKQAEAGFVRLGALLAVTAICGSVLACSWFKSETKKVEDAVIDCTKGELPAVVAAVEPLLEQLILVATGADGTVDWSQVNLKSLGAHEGMCVLADLFQKRTTQPPKLARGEVAPSPDALRQAVEAHRARFGLPTTLKVHTAHGDY